MPKKFDKRALKSVLKSQQNEITEYHIYNKLAAVTKNKNNANVLKRIANDEMRHYNFFKQFSGQDVEPSTYKIWKYYLMSRIFGLTFGVTLMEKGEVNAQAAYEKMRKKVPNINKVIKDEEDHEMKLIKMLDEEHLKYVGSVVLGLNDALVELTGALAGLTFALQNTRLIAVAGLVTGIAASFSMAASEYLAQKEDVESTKSPTKAAFYTGLAYIFTVMFLIFPFFLFNHYYVSLGVTLCNAVIVILLFTFYTSVANNLPFGRRFLVMFLISMGVAALSFGIGILVRTFLHVDI